MNKGISEILEEASKQSKVNDKVAVLQKNATPTLKMLLKMAFDKNLKWLIPPGEPPFNKNDAPGAQGALYGATKKFYLFVEHNGKKAEVNQIKREAIFIQILETLDPRDAVLLCSIKDKKIPYNGITKNLVLKAFPDISL